MASLSVQCRALFELKMLKRAAAVALVEDVDGFHLGSASFLAVKRG